MSAVPEPENIPTDLAGKNGKKLMAWRKSHGITRVTFAQVANCSERKLATYEKQTALPQPVQRQTTEAVRLLEALNEIIPEPQLADWLNTPNPGFSDRSPIQVMLSGEIDLLWDMVYQTRVAAYA
ncbi:DUF2384 domain-containing protein [Puniceicoccaceae bacterium K14]|nr:DUF2384 domain-containing protein [Puniceicoccaceae bacterium K14]